MTTELETPREARRHWSKAKYLTGKDAPHQLRCAIEAVDACGFSGQCGSALCPVCCRNEREWFGNEVIRFFNPIAHETKSVTALLNPLRASEISAFSIRHAGDALRAHLRRYNVCTVCVGFLEFKRDLERGLIIPHWHLIMHPPDSGGLELLRAHLKRNVGSFRPLQVVKFVPHKHATYHQNPSLVKKLRWAKDEREKRIQQKLIRAQAMFLADREFADFRFLMGCRLSGQKLVRLG